MVDHHVESACDVLSQKMQGVDAFSTPKIAPATPMQAWQKSLHRQESPDVLPSLSLGRSSAELKATYVTSNTSHSLSISAKCGHVGMPTPSRTHNGIGHKENLASFSLAKYEKSLEMATPLRNHMGPSSSHRVCAPAGDSKVPPVGCPAGVEEGTLHACKSEPATNDSEMICKADDRVSVYSPVPGEVANDAYKLYSKLFPSTSKEAAVCLPSSLDMEVHQNPFRGQKDSKRLLAPDTGGHQSPALERYSLNEVLPGVGKRFKSTTNGQGAISKRLLVAKEEPVFEGPYGSQEFSSCEDACPAGMLNSTWKDHSGPCKENVPKDFTFLKSLHVQPENMSTLVGSSITSEAFDHTANLGDCSVDVKPAIGLQLSTFSVDTQLPVASLTPCAGEPSWLLASKVGTWESPAQGNPSVDADWGKFLALSAMPSGNTDKAIMLPFQQRFKNLQAFLKQCDEADHHERLQGLRSLSAAARSGYAVDLETRAIRLSLEEGKELKRMRLLNVLGRASQSTLEELGATPHGPRLPVLGATSPLAHVP